MRDENFNRQRRMKSLNHILYPHPTKGELRKNRTICITYVKIKLGTDLQISHSLKQQKQQREQAQVRELLQKEYQRGAEEIEI